MYDVVVVGGGIAGIRAAVEAHRQGTSVALISRVNPTRSYSITLQDGVNAALGPGDSWEQHAKETVHLGDYLADQDVAAAVCREGLDIVGELDRMGFPFTRDDRGAPARAQLAGSSRPRTAFADDMTGHVATQVLYEQTLKAGIRIYEEWAVVALAVEDGRCLGVVALEMASGRLELVSAKAVVLATGGMRRLYHPSTSSLHCSGDGLALAYRAGASLIDMEMVQYHPYVVKGTRLALSELLRIQGRQVLNRAGEPFLLGLPTQGDGVPAADTMVRAITREIAEERGEEGCLFVDLSRDSGVFAERFFTTRHRVAALYGADLAESPLPVRPAMHHLLGGIATDLNGATDLPGLYAAGECAGATFHGAQGLEGNFLLASLVLGRRAGEAAAQSAKDTSAKEPTEEPLKGVAQHFDEVLGRQGDGPVAPLRQELAELMDRKVGPQRDGGGLREAAKGVERIAEAYRQRGVGSQGRGFNYGLFHNLELGYLLDVARTIIASASAREESRGVHFRADFPDRDDERWAQHILVSAAEEAPRLQFRLVHTPHWQPIQR